MQLNTSTNYAINIMLHLAKNKKVVSSTEISKSVAVSKRYLLQIAGKLRNGELIGVSLGSAGGYFLLKELSQINVYDIIILMEGEVRIISLMEDAVEHHTLYQAFTDLQHRIYHYLNSLTLDVLVSKSWPQCLEVLTDTMEPYYQSLRIGER